MSFSKDTRLGVDLAVNDTVAKHVLGARVETQDGKTYIYVQADASGHAVGSTVKVTSAYVTTTAGAGDNIFGVADIAVAASTYFWLLVRGQATNAKVTGSPASGSPLQRLSAATGNLQVVVAVNESGATVHAIGAQAVLGVTQSAVSAGVATVYLY
jgi:hypothetical protein